MSDLISQLMKLLIEKIHVKSYFKEIEDILFENHMEDIECLPCKIKDEQKENMGFIEFIINDTLNEVRVNHIFNSEPLDESEEGSECECDEDESSMHDEFMVRSETCAMYDCVPNPSSERNSPTSSEILEQCDNAVHVDCTSLDEDSVAKVTFKKSKACSSSDISSSDDDEDTHTIPVGNFVQADDIKSVIERAGEHMINAKEHIYYITECEENFICEIPPIVDVKKYQDKLKGLFDIIELVDDQLTFGEVMIDKYGEVVSDSYAGDEYAIIEEAGLTFDEFSNAWMTVVADQSFVE